MNILAMAGRTRNKAKETATAAAATTSEQIIEEANPSRIQKAKTSVKNGLNRTGKFFRELPHDTAEFVRKNPKKTGVIAGAVLFAGAAATIVGIAAKNALNNIRATKIENHFLKEKNNALEERVAEDNEMLEAMQDVVVAAQSIAAKAKKA